MTISALEKFDADDVFARNFGLYRDLSVALEARITLLQAEAAPKAASEECKATVEAIKAHQRALAAVLELEAGLVKRSRSWTHGGGLELDLGAARAEVAERLARWGAER